jgi:tetratricopeptide (TPR) repeat protein
MRKSDDLLMVIHRVWVLALVVAASCPASGGPRAEASGPGGGDSSKAESTDTTLLVDSFETFLKDQNVEAFRTRVDARYPEASLTGILANSPDVRARRAAALAAGFSASFRASNAAVAKGLKDRDAVVRSLTENALWAIWFRAGTPENNKVVEEVSRLIGERELDRAIAKATTLIAKAPDFAEAYNQRAIAHYLKGEHAKSIEDCREVLALNPYHFGALTGMAGCYRILGQPRKMLAALRQALRVRPHDEAIAETIKRLEAELGRDGNSQGIEA